MPVSSRSAADSSSSLSSEGASTGLSEVDGSSGVLTLVGMPPGGGSRRYSPMSKSTASLSQLKNLRLRVADREVVGWGGSYFILSYMSLSLKPSPVNLQQSDVTE